MAIVANDDNIQLERIETAPFGTNAYIIICKATGESVLIDAPGEATQIEERLKERFPTAEFSPFVNPKKNEAILEQDLKAEFEDWLKGTDAVITAFGD